MSLRVIVDRSLVRASGGSVRHVLATVEAPMRADARPRLPLNLALVIDRSGSMGGEKIEQAREAAAYVVQQLKPHDRFAVVAYDDRIDVIVPSTCATPEARESAARAIEGLHARGSTDLGGGWLTGCQEIAEHLDGEQIARCLLVTDGLANRGITDPTELCRHAAELRARGITTSTFGIGDDFDEVRLSAMAEAGGGTFRLIRLAEEIPTLIRQELQEGFDVIAPQAVLEVRTQPEVSVASLNDFRVAFDEPGITRVHLGDLVSGQVIEPIIRLRFASGEKGVLVPVVFRLHDRDGVLADPEASVGFEYAGDSANDRQPRNRTVDRRVAALYAARVKREALAFNRDGDFRAAERVVEQCLRRVREYAADDAELQAIVADLEAAKRRYGRDMDQMHRKQHYAQSVADLKGRMVSGAAQRQSEQSVVIVPCSADAAAAAHIAVQALQPDGWPLLGRLRVSDSWMEWQRRIPIGPQITPVQENLFVDAARMRWADAGARVVLTVSQLPDNWFSHWDPVGRTAIVSLFRVEGLVGVELAAYLAYECLLNGLNNASPRYDLLRLAHRETRGCLFDFCGDKRDMEVKLQTMHLCATCEQGLDSLHIDTVAVARLTDVIRYLARPVRQVAT